MKGTGEGGVLYLSPGQQFISYRQAAAKLWIKKKKNCRSGLKITKHVDLKEKESIQQLNGLQRDDKKHI